MALLWVDGFENYGTSTGSAPSPAGIMARKYNVMRLRGHPHLDPTREGERVFRGALGRRRRVFRSHWLDLQRHSGSRSGLLLCLTDENYPIRL